MPYLWQNFWKKLGLKTTLAQSLRKKQGEHSNETMEKDICSTSTTSEIMECPHLRPEINLDEYGTDSAHVRPEINLDYSKMLASYCKNHICM